MVGEGGQSKAMELREAVRFLVRLSAIESPESLRPGDLLNLLDDLRRFLDIHAGGKLQHELNRARKRPRLLRPLVEDVRKLVSAATDGRRVEFKGIGLDRIVFDGSKLGSRDALLSDGSLRHVVVDYAATDLSDLKPGNLGRCPICQKVFLANRKGQRFCSHACAVRQATQKYQRTHRAERAGRERERRQRAKLNPPVTPPEVSDGQATR